MASAALSIAAVFAHVANQIDPRIPALLVSDLIFSPMINARGGTNREPDLRDTFIRLASIAVVPKLLPKLVPQLPSFLGLPSNTILIAAWLHTVHMMILRLLRVKATSPDEGDGVFGTTQSRIPIVPVVDIAIIAGASLLITLLGGRKVSMVLFLVYVLGIGGRDAVTIVKEFIRAQGIPVGVTGGLSLVGLLVGGVVAERMVGINFSDITS